MLTGPKVAKHTSADDCWVVLYGNVYDVTEFLPSHPGGSNIILKLAGKDATFVLSPSPHSHGAHFKISETNTI